MKQTPRKSFALGSILICCWIVMATAASGAVITLIDEPFDAPVDGLPDGWAVRVENNAVSGNLPRVLDLSPTRVQFETGGSNDDPKASIVYTEAVYADLHGSAIFNFGSLRRVMAGFTIRTDPAEAGEFWPAGGYTLGFGNRVTPNAEWFVGIFYSEMDHDYQRNNALVYVDVPDQTAGFSGDHELRFSAYESVITFSVWTVGAQPSEVVSVSLENADRTDAGLFGIHADIHLHSTARRFGVYNLHVEQIIPEPGTVALLGFAALLLRGLRRTDPVKSA